MMVREKTNFASLRQARISNCCFFGVCLKHGLRIRITDRSKIRITDPSKTRIMHKTSNRYFMNQTPSADGLGTSYANFFPNTPNVIYRWFGHISHLDLLRFTRSSPNTPPSSTDGFGILTCCTSHALFHKHPTVIYRWFGHLDLLRFTHAFLQTPHHHLPTVWAPRLTMSHTRFSANTPPSSTNVL